MEKYYLAERERGGGGGGGALHASSNDELCYVKALVLLDHND